MNLYEILNECVNKDISTFYIKGNKIFPLNDNKLTFKLHFVKGYFCIYDNICNQTLLLLSLRLIFKIKLNKK